MTRRGGRRQHHPGRDPGTLRRRQPRVATRVTGMERLRNSTNGNPEYRLVTESGRFETSTDADVAYGLSESLVGKPVRLTLAHNGAVIDVEDLLLTQLQRRAAAALTASDLGVVSGASAVLSYLIDQGLADTHSGGRRTVTTVTLNAAGRQAAALAKELPDDQ